MTATATPSLYRNNDNTENEPIDAPSMFLKTPGKRSHCTLDAYFAHSDIKLDASPNINRKENWMLLESAHFYIIKIFYFI